MSYNHPRADNEDRIFLLYGFTGHVKELVILVRAIHITTVANKGMSHTNSWHMARAATDHLAHLNTDNSNSPNLLRYVIWRRAALN